METYIDDLADGWVADIKGEHVKIPDINSNSGDVTLPGAEMKPGDVVIDTYTPAGKAKFLELTKRGYTVLEALQEMVNGTHFTRKIVPFSSFHEIYGDPFATDKNLYDRNNRKRAEYKQKRSVQQNPHHLFR